MDPAGHRGPPPAAVAGPQAWRGLAAWRSRSGLHQPPRRCAPVWHHTFDLRVYRGAVRWWLDGRPLYDFVRPHTEKGFTYPPFAVLVLLPLALGTETRRPSS